MQKTPLQLLFVILILGSIVRLVGLGSVPRGFTPDEASQAYTAYSLLLTGKDEWATTYPLSSFKSFLDYKSPLQTYLMVPSIALFGLNEFSARLPSAIFGILAIASAYFLTNVIFKSTKTFNMGHLSALVLAFSPWAIQFSRMALEANLAVFLFLTGLAFFIASENKPKYLFFSAFFFSTALYSYHAAKLFIPLFVLGLAFIYKKSLLKNVGITLSALLLAVVISFPLIVNLFGTDSRRGGELLITNLSGDQEKQIDNNYFYSDLYKVSPPLSKLFHNKLTFVANQFTNNYLSYFSPHFWFLEGGREITYSVIPGRGLLLLFYLPFVIYGAYCLWQSGIGRKTKLVLLLWLVLAPLPAALTKEGYRPNRAISFMFFWELIAVFGIWNFLYQKPMLLLKTAVVGTIASLSLIFYFEDYFFSSFVKFPEAMSYGWRQVISFTKDQSKNYNEIQIEQGGQPQSMVAFYEKVAPQAFQKSTVDWQNKINTNKDTRYLDQLGDYSLQKYRFKRLNWPEDINSKTLFVARQLAVLPQERRTLHKVTTPQGKVLFEIFDFPQKP